MESGSRTLPEELLLMLLNEDTGSFYQVTAWHLNCAVIGAVLGELSLRGRIDTDLKTLFLVDDTETGDPVLDPILIQIASEPEPQNTQFWIERLAGRAESVIDQTLERLVDINILEHHEGDFWTLSRTAWINDKFSDSTDTTAGELIKTRIGRVIFTNEIPDPRDIIIIALVNTCEVFHLIFQLDKETEERIELLCQMDLIGRSMADAIIANKESPLMRRSLLARKIPSVPLSRVVRDPHVRNGLLPAFLAGLAKEFGPVFKISPPFTPPKYVLCGPEINSWVNRHGRMHLRTRDYFGDFESVYGATGVMPGLDGADHFRMRRGMAPAYSRRRVMARVDDVYKFIRGHISQWPVGHVDQARRMCRRLANMQISPLHLSVDSMDLFNDLIDYKERALATHLSGSMPKFMLKTPAMRRKSKALTVLMERVQDVHTPAQRAGQPRDLVDDVLELNANDQRLVPETNLMFALSAAPIASVYFGDMLSYGVYAMASQPDHQAKIREEADALFADGDPPADALSGSAVDHTKRFIMECLRMYPIVPISMRTVMNSFVIENCEVPLGVDILIAQTAPHYMEELFPDPFTFDIDRYKSPRNEHRSPGYAPYGLGTHRCLGFRGMEFMLLVNILMLARYFQMDPHPVDFKLGFAALPSSKPSKKLSFRVAKKHREIPV